MFWLVIASMLPATDPCANPRYGCVDGKSPMAWEREVRVAKADPKHGDVGCLKRLRQAHIKFRVLENVKGVKTPIEVTDKSLGLVKYVRTPGNKRRFILDCHTVEVIAALGKRLRKAGFATLYWSSAWRYTTLRDSKELSQHAYGKAFDITAVDGVFGYASVKGHWERGVDRCGREAKTKRGKALRRLACELTRGKAFARVFTPDKDADHADHFHLEEPHPDVRHARSSGLSRKRRMFIVGGILFAGLALVFAGWWFGLRKRERREKEPPEGSGDGVR